MGRGSRHVAVDLGAESCRVVLGYYDGDRIRAQEAYRFATPEIRSEGLLSWDHAALFGKVCDGLAAARARACGEIDTVAVDSWGVDFGLMAEDGHVLAPPRQYRDPRNGPA